LRKCETLADWKKMYNSGPSSCMTDNSAGRSWAGINEAHKKEEGYSPVFWYHFNPETSGYYVQRKGSITARVICHERGKARRYGRLYSSNSQDGDALLKLLKAEGYTSEKDLWTCKTSFDVPVYKYSGEHYVPMPFFDKIRSNFHAAYDDKRGVVIFTPGTSNSRNVQGNLTCGYVDASQLRSVKCKSCSKLNNPRSMSHALDGSYFCDSRCSRDAGYITAIRSDGVAVIVAPSHEVVHDVLTERSYYTNMEAALANGCLPLMNGYEVPEDKSDVPVTRQGYNVQYHGKRYMMEASTVDRFQRAGIMSSDWDISRLLDTPVLTNIKITSDELLINRKA
jgi:hypothetical protein